LRLLRRRFEGGAPLSLGEAVTLLDALEREGPLAEPLLRRLVGQLHPSIGELIPVRASPLPRGEGCRCVPYWEGRGGWARGALATSSWAAPTSGSPPAATSPRSRSTSTPSSWAPACASSRRSTTAPAMPARERAPAGHRRRRTRSAGRAERRARPRRFVSVP